MKGASFHQRFHTITSLFRQTSRNRATSCHLMQCSGQRQYEFRNFDLKLFSSFSHAQKFSLHGTLRCGKRSAACIFEFLTGLDQRLSANDAQPSYFLDMIVRVGNDPVPRDQLRTDLSCIPDRDGIGKDVTAPFRSGLIIYISGRHRDIQYPFTHGRSLCSANKIHYPMPQNHRFATCQISFRISRYKITIYIHLSVFSHDYLPYRPQYPLRRFRAIG